MKSNPRGDTQIVSGLSVSLSTLSGGIFLLSGFQPLLNPLPPSLRGGCVCREHYSLSRRLLASPIHPSPSLADYIRGQILRRSGGTCLSSSPSLATYRTHFTRPGRALHVVRGEERPDRRRESFPRGFMASRPYLSRGEGRGRNL